MRTRIFSLLGQFVTSRPKFVLWIAALLTVASTYLALTQLHTNTNQDDLVSEDLAFHARYKDYLRDFGDQEFVYVIVQAAQQPTQARTFIDALENRLRSYNSIDLTIARLDLEHLQQQGLLHLPTDQLEQLTQQLASPQLGLGTMQSWRGAEDVLQSVLRNMRGAPSNTQSSLFLERYLGSLLAGAHGETYSSPFAGLFGEAQDNALLSHDGYLQFGNGKFLVVQIMPRKDYSTLEVIAQPLEDIRSALDATRTEFPNIKSGLTGRPILAADEMAATNRDMTIATIIALVSILVLFIITLRRFVEPCFALIALLAGMSWTYGFAALSIGSLNLLSIVFSVILVGAGIEFGLHMVPRFREEIAQGASPQAAAMNIITHTGSANWTAGVTTAASLYAAYYTDFLALRELGLIAGTGILLCFLSMLTILPALLQLHAERSSKAIQGAQQGMQVMPLGWLYTRPRRILSYCAVLAVLAGAFIPQLGFNHNLLDLQVQELESVQYEKLITTESEQSTWQAVMLAPDLAQADALAKQLRALPSVGQIEYARDLVPTEQKAKLQILQNTREIVPTFSLPSAREQMHLPRLSTQLAYLAHGLARAQGEATQTLREHIDNLRAALRSGDAQVATNLHTYQRNFTNDLATTLRYVHAALNAERIALSDYPDFFAQRYQGASGQYALYITPAHDIWDPSHMATFVNELRSIDPLVTGVPIEVYEASKLMERSFYETGVLAFVCIFFLIWFDLRSLRDTCLALTPIFTGLLLLFGCMGAFGIALNLANFFAMPIIIGIGLNDGVQIMHRVRERGGYFDELMTHSTGYGVVLASLTAFASFASLTVAAHQGLASLGIVLGLGIALCMVGSTIVLPNLLALGIRRSAAALPSTKYRQAQ